MNSTHNASIIISELSELFSKRSKEAIYEFIEKTPREKLLSDIESVVSSREGDNRLKEDPLFSAYFFTMLSSLLFKIQSQETKENQRIESPFSKKFYSKIDEIISTQSTSQVNEYFFKQ